MATLHTGHANTVLIDRGCGGLAGLVVDKPRFECKVVKQNLNNNLLLHMQEQIVV